MAETKKKVKPGYKAAAKKDKNKKQGSEKKFYKAPPKKTAEASSRPKKNPKAKLEKQTEATSGAGNAREVAKVIQWFPGHMTKALREMEASLKQVDIVLELCDARIPESSRNPKVPEIVGQKPYITIMNKCALADPAKNQKYKEELSKDGHRVIFTDCMTGQGIDEIVPAIRTALKEKLERYEAKGMKKVPRAMIIGVTNCGKSTLINRLYGSRKAKSENRPGVTRTQQWVTVEDKVDLLDTPGVLWPKFDEESVGLNLAYTGAIRDEILDIESIAVLLTQKLMDTYPNLMFNRYKITAEDVDGKLPHEIFEAIGKKRGLLISGGEVDYLRCARMILDEFRDGKIGRITLD